MSRGRDIDQERENRSHAPGEARSEDFERDSAERELTNNTRESIRFRDKTYWIKPDDLTTMKEIGKFRTLAEEDLARFLFHGDSSRMNYELGLLARQGLIRRYSIGKETTRGFHACVLTGDGRQLVQSRGQTNQRIYSDLKKPTEAFHDAAIYRMYQAERAKIRSAGGRVCRVVLDYELKRNIYRPLARIRQTAPELLEAKRQEVALANGLQVRNGKIPLPDLRIEYETRDGEAARVDLELAAQNYKKSQIAEKARAGFKLYFAGSSGSGSGTVWENRELIAEILSL